MKKKWNVVVWLLAFTTVFSVLLSVPVSKAASEGKTGALSGNLNPGGNSGNDQDDWENFGKEEVVDPDVPMLKLFKKDVIESKYRIYDSATGKYTYHAPELEGFLFAGWYRTGTYEEATYQNALKQGETLALETYYALFVPEAVLGVQAQVTANLLDDDLADDSRGAIRFVTSIDSLNYREVGFYFDIEGGATNYKVSSATVYDKLIAVHPKTGEKEKEETAYTPNNIFSPASKYFKTCIFYNLSAKLYDVDITATPFWKTLDGTVVRVTSQTKTVNMGRNAKTVYLASTGSDTTGDGTKGNPYQTLWQALKKASDRDVVYVKDEVTVTGSTASWSSADKDVLITGKQLDFSNINSNNQLNINSGVTFTDLNLIFKDDAAIYANGNRLRMESDVSIIGYTRVFGAGPNKTVAGTDVTLLAGDYRTISGAGTNAIVNGDTHVYIGGDVNKTRDLSTNQSFVVYGSGNKSIVNGSTNIYVGGNVNSEFNVATETKATILYGGGSNSIVEGNTNIIVEGNAQFNRIYGGGYQGTIKGNTNVTVRGNVNHTMNGTSSHTWYTVLFGGATSYGTTEGSVLGDTNVTIDGDAQFTHVYGGGEKPESAEADCITGNTYVHLTKNAKNAKLMSIYGGSRYGTNKNTSVVMEAGEVEQIFGGSDRTSMTGSTDVRLLGGKVTRRVYGGCYNDYSLSGGWASQYYVEGNTSVAIGKDMTLKLSDTDHGIVAGSRYKADFADEVGTIVFLDGADYTSQLGSSYFSKKAYNYLVKVPAGGTVSLEGNALRIIPDLAGSGVSVQGVDASYLTETEVGYLLTLPPIAQNQQKTMQVTFYTEEQVSSSLDSYSWKGKKAEAVYDCGGLAKNYGQKEDSSCQLFNVAATSDEDVIGFVHHLTGNGWCLKSHTSLDANQFYRLTCGKRKVSVNYYGRAEKAMVISEQAEKAFVSDLSYTYEPQTGEAAGIYMFGLKMDPNGYNAGTEKNTSGYPNNGECLVIKCADNSVIIVDGGDSLQMKSADQMRFINFLHEITGKASDEVITISAWYITHFHRDHISGMKTLITSRSKNFKLERVICNMPSLEAVSISKPSPANFETVSNLISKYYPQCQEIKVHTGDVVQIADVTMTALFTHEDIVDNTGKFMSDDFNTTSTVMRIETASGMSMMVTGDMSVAAENILCSNFFTETLKCDILQQPHHNINNNTNIYEYANAQVMLFTQREGQFDITQSRREQADYAISWCKEWYCQGDKTVGFNFEDGKVKLIYEKEDIYD